MPTSFLTLHTEAFREGSHHLDWRMGAINTFFLLTSGLTMGLAVFAAQNGQQNNFEIVDVDGDGKPDVIGVGPVSNTFYVLQNTCGTLSSQPVPFGVSLKIAPPSEPSAFWVVPRISPLGIITSAPTGPCPSAHSSGPQNAWMIFSVIWAVFPLGESS